MARVAGGEYARPQWEREMLKKAVSALHFTGLLR